MISKEAIRTSHLNVDSRTPSQASSEFTSIDIETCARKFVTSSNMEQELQGPADTLIKHIHDSVIGSNLLFKTPYGVTSLLYADFTASGRSLTFIEDHIRNHVLPFYANTHTKTSVAGLQTTSYRDDARKIIRGAANCSEDDDVIFTGGWIYSGYQSFSSRSWLVSKESHTLKLQCTVKSLL
jgi:hypothetical protein